MALRQVERTGQSTPARAGKSSSAEARFRQMKRHPRNRSERAPARPAAALRPGPRREPEPRTNPAKNRPHRTDPGLWDAAPGEKGSMNPYNQRRQPARLHSWTRCARTRTKT